jgi:hypothetical protein
VKKRPPTFRRDSVTYVDVAQVLRRAGKGLTLFEIAWLRSSATTTTAQVLRQMVAEGRVKKTTVTAYKWSSR